MERRRHTRFPLIGVAEICPIGSESRIMVSIHDISIGGVAIYSGVEFPEDQLLQMKLIFKVEGWQQVEVLKGKVRRRMDWGPKKHVIGIEFLEELTPKNAPVLFAHMEFLEGLKGKKS